MKNYHSKYFKRILITGSNGLLGQKLVYKLLQQHDTSNILIIGCGKGDNRNILEGYIYESVDISDKTQVETLFNKYKPTHVIHTAAQTNVDYCELNPEECYKANVLSVEYLIENCSKHQSYLIHISTDFIFDGLKNSLYTEVDTPSPVSIYGNSKLQAEKIVKNSTLNWCILRTILVYGVVHDMSRSNIVLWVKKNLQDHKTIQVVTDQFRTPTLAEDLADACILALEKNATGIFNIGGRDYLSIYEIACIVAEHFMLNKQLIQPVNSSIFTQPAKRPPKTGFNIDKAIKILNYNPHTFKEGLKIVAEQLKS